MQKNKKCVAMLLAGGQGSRLYALTDKTAKPAVRFGGKYRIIDFPLSNCINSGIDTVGVLTQYEPLVLNEYIGNGQPWDLDRNHGGVKILPPYRGKKSDWYKGTANAIFQNLKFIKRYNPEYVLIISGDHIYKMDYSKMLNYHEKRKSDCTIAVIDVPISEASRFGIMNAKKDGRITEFEEKPKNPKSTKASMGIYIFSANVLYEFLEKDNLKENTSYDFGKNVIPDMLANNKKLYAYTFEGYWKDVGTIDSLWSANMDLIGSSPSLSLNDKRLKVFSGSSARPPHYIGKEGHVKNSIITEGCEIYGTVENSILSPGVKILNNAVVRDSVIMDNVVIKENAAVDYSIIDSSSEIGKNAIIGEAKENNKKITVIGADIFIKDDDVIKPGEMVRGAI